MNREIRQIYFLGIGGIGMSALARFFAASGYAVSGYDKTATPLTRELEASGMTVVYNDAVEAIPAAVTNAPAEEVLLVYTPAIPADHRQWMLFREQGRTLYKRAEVLGMITRNNPTLAVAGTHGKTTTSTLLAHLLKSAGKDVTAFLGGISANYSTNYLQAENTAESIVVVEADEYDRSFLHLRPQMAVITSMDPDHLDIYGDKTEMHRTFNEFASLIPSEGFLLIKSGLPVAVPHKTYSIRSVADYYATDIRVEKGSYYFDLNTPQGRLPALSVGLPGRHNVENAVAASALALQNGLDEEQLRRGLASFQGVKRRFEYLIKKDNQVFIDDYAHHPEELRACIQSVKELYPGKKVTGVFQPHLFSRTRDFLEGFAEVLSLLDTCVLLDIYPAREKPLPGVSSAALLEKINCADKQLLQKGELADFIRLRKPMVLLSLGAGDIDLCLNDMKEALQ